MPNLNELLTFDYTNEHVFEHDLLVKNNFSNPNIYTANGDLKKRWYVYFSFRNPKTGKLQRMKNIYGKTNSYKTKEDRLLFLSAYRKKLLYLLNHGYNPFEDNSELHQKRRRPGHLAGKPLHLANSHLLVGVAVVCRRPDHLDHPGWLGGVGRSVCLVHLPHCQRLAQPQRQ